MRITHISTSFSNQSAGYRLHLEFIKKNIDSNVLLKELRVPLIKTKAINLSKLNKLVLIPAKIYFNNIEVYKYKKRISNLPFSNFRFGFSVKNDSLITESDIIHLHWINSAYLSIKTLEELFKTGKKIIWTFHDNWPFTGGCHVRLSCEKFKISCGNCPILNSSKTHDLSNRIWKQKHKLFEKFKFSIITPSRWMYDNAKSSSLLKDKKIYHIPNLINTFFFKPLNKKFSKNILNISENKYVIAINISSVIYKGSDYFVKTLQILKAKNGAEFKDLLILVYGVNEYKPLDVIPIEVKYLGFFNDEISLLLLYNASDVYVTPSIEDNFPNTVLESLSCGTPVVAFNTGGIPEMVDHKINGYIAEYKNSEDLANGIIWCMLQENEIISNNARNKVLLNYKPEVIVTKHMNVYDDN